MYILNGVYALLNNSRARNGRRTRNFTRRDEDTRRVLPGEFPLLTLPTSVPGLNGV